MTTTTLREVRKRYSRRGPWVLDGADLQLEPATLTRVEGGNGSGKSTLLLLAAGLTPPTRGKVCTPPRSAYVPERQPETVRFTATEYLVHLAGVRGVGSRQARALSWELCDRLDLRPGPDVPFHQLSKGNRQELLLAQAFVCPVDLVVLDEPFNGLDAGAAAAAGDLIDDACGRGAAVLLTDHDRRAELPHARTVCVADSRLIEVSSSGEKRLLRGTKQVVLRRPPGVAGPRALVGLPGVLSAASEGDRIWALEVSSVAVDALLMRCISQGWSVESVLPRPNEPTSKR